MRSLRLSVILPTFNRADSLRRALTALLRQDADPRCYEVVVVDNNSTDSTPEVLASMAEPRVRSLREARQGLAFARNAGLAAARGDVLAFTDDDVEVEPGWITGILAACAAHPEVDGVGGQVLPAWDAPPPDWLTRQHWGPLALQDHGPVERTFDAECPLGLVGANVAFRRRVFERIGEFSPAVQRVGDGIGSTEDHEMLGRLYDAGGRMLYHPGIRVIARVQPERYGRDYHRRWHAGHGSFHALMRRPDMERSRASIAGVPAHLVRAAAGHSAQFLWCAMRGCWDDAFVMELRLHFFWGFVRARLAGGPSGSVAAPVEWVP